MQPIQSMSRADEVRRFVLERIVLPSRAAGMRSITVRAGDVQRDLGWVNRTPSVCSALDAREFQQMSHTRLVERRGPAQSTTVEWVFALEESPSNAPEVITGRPPVDTAGRRLVAEWDGVSFRPAVVPDNLEVGQRVVLFVNPVQAPRELAGKFANLVGTLSEEEAAEMLETIESAFETISDDW